MIAVRISRVLEDYLPRLHLRQPGIPNNRINNGMAASHFSEIQCACSDHVATYALHLGLDFETCAGFPPIMYRDHRTFEIYLATKAYATVNILRHLNL